MQIKRGTSSLHPRWCYVQVVEGGPIRDVVMDALTSEREKAQAHFARADLVSRTGSHMVLTCTPAVRKALKQRAVNQTESVTIQWTQ